MATFKLHTLESAPQASKPLLEGLQKQWGFVPTLDAILAESPPALEGFLRLLDLADKSTLPPAELQLVFLAVSVSQKCEYCASGHTYLARAAKLDEEVVQAVRNGKPIANSRLQALRDFTDAVTRERGYVGDAAVDKFISAGFTQANVLEVVLVIATKTISNFLYPIAHVPLESFMKDPTVRWTAAGKRQVA